MNWIAARLELVAGTVRVGDASMLSSEVALAGCAATMIAVVGAGAMGAALTLAGNRTPRSLANAGLIEVRDEKGPQVADRLFVARYAPWCPDNF